MHHVIFDLEATCWRLRRPPRQEIIEIGAVMVSDAGEIVGEFDRFIRPKLNPKLSEFCKELTSIQQADVDGAADFQDVIWEFEDWLKKANDRVTLYSWGDYDKQQLLMDAELHQMEIPWVHQHMCLKSKHARLLRLKEPVGVRTALALSGLLFEGTSHRGIVDAINTARLFVHHFGDFSQ
jgi:inhibitor of KinA sporulation pathway (predicted exonuclease)